MRKATAFTQKPVANVMVKGVFTGVAGVHIKTSLSTLAEVLMRGQELL